VRGRLRTRFLPYSVLRHRLRYSTIPSISILTSRRSRCEEMGSAGEAQHPCGCLVTWVDYSKTITQGRIELLRLRLSRRPLLAHMPYRANKDTCSTAAIRTTCSMAHSPLGNADICCRSNQTDMYFSKAHS
jgi:hypothetical protein